MPLIQRFRIDNTRPERDQLEFYLKINNDSNKKLMNLCISGDGLYYYKPGSQILSPKENIQTRNTYDGYMSMENLKSLFEQLSKAGWSRKGEEGNEIKLIISRSGKSVTIEVI